MIRAKQSAQVVEAAPQVRDFDLDLSEIKLDQSAQPREALNNDRIAEYAEAMKAGDQFPPLTVFHEGSTYWLADGFHRHYAAQHAGRKHIRCYVRQGGLRDAILWSVGANAKHGLARSDEDKKRAVMRLLDDAEWSTWTDRDIAKRCRVSHPFVAKIRKAQAGHTGNASSMERTYVHPKTGKPTTMKTAGINASRTQFQAKASEDNGSITGGAGAVTGEASRLAFGRTDAGEAASVDLPTISDAERDADAIQAPFDRASDEGRAIFLARNNLKSSDGERPIEAAGSEHHSAARNGATMEQSDVDGSATARTPAGEDSFALAGQIETRTEAEIVDGNASLAAREGEKPLHSNPPSAANPAEAVAIPQAPQAATATNYPDPHSERLTTGGLHTSLDDAGAKSDGLQSVVGQGGAAPDIRHSQSKQQPAVKSRGGNSAASGASASVTKSRKPLRPHCLNPDLCAGSGREHCHVCKKAMAESEAA